MAKFIVGIVVGILAVFAAGYVFVVTGGMPVATKGGPMPLEKWVARTSIHAALASARDVTSPLPASEVNLVAGAKAYVNDCAGCHGLPQHPSEMRQAMYPHPPQLFEPDHGVEDDPVGVIHWKVRNGIRLTAMPAFADLMKEPEAWQVTLFLKNGDKLPQAAQEVLRAKPQ